MPIINYIISQYRSFIYIIGFSIFLAFILSLTLPKKYKASTTFIITQNKQTSNFNGTSLLNSLGFTSSMNGASTTGVYMQYLLPIFNSYRIKKNVANKLRYWKNPEL